MNEKFFISKLESLYGPLIKKIMIFGVEGKFWCGIFILPEREILAFMGVKEYVNAFMTDNPLIKAFLGNLEILETTDGEKVYEVSKGPENWLNTKEMFWIIKDFRTLIREGESYFIYRLFSNQAINQLISWKAEIRGGH